MSSETWSAYKTRGSLFGQPEALKGLKVVEVSTLVFGPLATSILGHFGADIIKVELPPLGDTMRGVTPFGELHRGAGSYGMMTASQNKYSLGLDLHHEEAQQVFLRIVKDADIVLENLRPGAMDAWNCGYRNCKEVNPEIIYVAMNGFGQWGPWAEENRASYDALAQSWSGHGWMTGFPDRTPLKPAIWIMDGFGGMMGAGSIMAALNYREKTGKGQFIELSQSENGIRMLAQWYAYQSITGKEPIRSGNRDLCICPADTFRCKEDRFIAIAAPQPQEFKGLCEAMGQPNLVYDPRFKDHTTRLKDENATEILKIISDWARTKTVEEIDLLAVKYGFAASQLYNAEDLCKHNAYLERQTIATFDDPIWGPMQDIASPVKMSKTPPRLEWLARPTGMDNDYILKKFGYSNEEIEGFYEKKVVSKGNPKMPASMTPVDWDGKSGITMDLGFDNEGKE